DALGDKKGIRRYGHFTLTMDEVLTTVAVDLGGRYNFTYKGPDAIKQGKFGIYDAELSLEFLQKFAMNAKMNLHVLIHHGDNRHHLHESVFKALGRALRMAIELDPRAGNSIPSTKGVLE
ncbi:MAG: imidazoleglycerol-phosphate dehydratase, partial [Spirochaetia bacterium]|nr:imidazoleglycerol-phosphate dehydratase [Spirochaetia bacterium]